MAGKESESARVKRWFGRITSAEKVRETWEKRFNPTRLQQYWEGYQWGDLSDEEALKKYTINLTYASLEAEKPSLFFRRPVVKMTPRPGQADDFGSDVLERAALCQATVQTALDDPAVHFKLETDLALHEAFFRYGVVEVGYTADFIDNPHADKPVLKGESEDPLLDQAGQTVRQPKRVIGKESVFVKRIPAARFLVSMSSKNALTDNDWVAYWDWHYVEDIKRHVDYQNTSTLKATGIISERLRGGDVLDREESERRHGMVRLWKLWDLRLHERHVLAEGHQKFLIEAEPFTTLPFAVMKFHERLDDFYPLPPIFNWISPQDELNETREMQRAHRRRFTRRYTYRDGVFNVGELEKLESGGDGVYAMCNGAPGEVPLQPVPDAPLDGSIWNNLAAAKDDFGQVSGIMSEMRGVPQSSTATQANIMNINAQMRGNAARVRVGDWLAEIARILLETVREKMALPFWVQQHVDLSAPEAMQETERVVNLWKKITSVDLDGVDLDVTIDMASLSPVTQDAQSQTWDAMLERMTNPAILGLIAQSPYLLRQTLKFAGILSETDIRMIEESLQQTFLQQKMEAMAMGGSPSAGKGTPSPPSDVMPQAGLPQGAGSLG